MSVKDKKQIYIKRKTQYHTHIHHHSTVGCQDKQFQIESTDQLLSLMELYLSEWQHRDNLFFKEIFTYFFSSLVVMILPFADIWNLHFPKEIPQWLFPAIGMLMAVAFFIVSNGYIARLKALSDPYQKLIDKLPPELRREKVKDMYSGVWGAVMNWRMASFICWFMFLALLIIGATLLYFTIN